MTLSKDFAFLKCVLTRRHGRKPVTYRQDSDGYYDISCGRCGRITGHIVPTKPWWLR